MYEYHCFTTLALHAAAQPEKRVPGVRSTVVLLRGRQAPWPATRAFRVSPRGDRFSGLRVHVEAVYQRTLAELEARATPLWLIFAPLAVDATPEAMPEVLRRLRATTTTRQFEELAVAMTVLADADGRARGLRETLTAHLPEDLIMQSWVYKQGLHQGISQGISQGRQEGLAPLLHLMARRLGRALSEAELDVVRARIDTSGPDRLGDVALDLAPAELAAWLAEATAR